MQLDTTAVSVDPMEGFVADIGFYVTVVLSTDWVIFVLVPVLVIVGAIFLKALARPTFKIRQEDWTFGFDLGITACITLLVSSLVLVNQRSGDNAAGVAMVQYYLLGVFVVFLLFLGLLGIGAMYFRIKGWVSKDKIVTVNRGVQWTVNLGGIFLLIVAFNLTGGAYA